MRYFHLGLWTCLFCLFTSMPASAESDTTTGKQLAEDIFHRDRGENSVLTSQMVLVDKNDNKRVRQFISKRIQEKELERQIIRFTSPADIEGTGFLTIEKPGWETEQFIYLPALRRTRRIVTSQKSHRFVNSDFTYEDMERHPVDDYTYKITGSQTIGGVACHAMETRPKEGVPSQYSLTQSLITKESLVPVLVKYFDKKGDHIKTYKVLKLEKIQNIWTEILINMEDHEREHNTYIQIDSITYNTDIDKADISRNSLENY
ncbi:MAG: outer membrane lipoprotein-sorting protein [Desulfotignum sp.]